MKKDKNGKRIFSAMDGIGDDLINEASAYKAEEKSKNTGEKKRSAGFFQGWRRYATVAVALLLVTAITVVAIIGAASSVKKPAVAYKPEGILLSGDAYAVDGLADVPDELKSVSVTADGTDSRLISTAASFRITTCGACDVDTLAKYVTVTPSTYMSVTQVSDTVFDLKPAEDGLVPGTVYRVMVGNPENPVSSYAFQTESNLIVKSVLPTDKAENVPLNTGIEIYFSDSVKTADLESFVSVSPEVKGEWYRYPDGRTVAFVPTDKLAPNTVYTVTVEPGIESATGKKLEKETVSYFRTEAEETDSKEPWISISLGGSCRNLTSVFSPKDEAYISLYYYYYNVKQLENSTVKLYKFPTVEAAMNAIADREKTVGTDENYKYDVSGLDFISETKLSVSTAGLKNGSGNTTAYLGAGLEKGVYLTEVTVCGEGTLQKASATAYGFIQISGLRAFTASSDGKSLVWLNDDRGSNVSGAAVSGSAFNRGDEWSGKPASDFAAVSAKTAADGTALIENGGRAAMLVTVVKDGDGLVLCANCEATDEGEYFMRYVYTDRETYFSDDVVNFFGFIIPAYGEKLPSALYLQTGNSSVKTKIEYNSDGSFSGKYFIENMRAGGIYLKIVDADGRIYASKYISVTLEEKPVITASMSFDKPFYLYGDTLKATVTASFYDGTPAQGFTFTVAGWTGGTSISAEKKTLTTGADGTAVFTFRLGYCKAWSTDPVTVSVTAELTGMETQRLTTSESALYFHSDYVYGINYDEDCRRITLNYRDTSAIKTADDLNYTFIAENTVGAPADGTLKYTLVKYVITKTEMTGYDSYFKKTYKYYDYDCKNYTVKSESVSFKNGVVELPLYEVEGFTGGYYYELSYSDGRNTYSDSVSATKGSYYYYGGDTNVSEWSMALDKDAYGVGEKVTVSCQNGTGEKANMLFMTFGNGLHCFGVGDSFGYEFTEDMIPGSTVYGAMLDARYGRFNTYSANPRYDYERSASVDIEITADRESYKPGETAVLTIKAGGSGQVLISIVDEACFALGAQNANALSAFNSLGEIGFRDYIGYYYYYYYSRQVKPVTIQSYFSAVESSASSYARYDRNGITDKYSLATEASAESDTGGTNEGQSSSDSSYYVRKYFADNPVFSVVKLDKNGEGKLIFTVPDNITTWRITATAAEGLGGNLASVKLGTTVTATVCTQPFFTNINVCSRYIVGDDVSASFRSYGRNATGTISYRAVLTGENGVVAEKTLSGEPAEHAWANFGKLEEGQYKLTVYADCESEKDAVEAKFSVIKSNVAADVFRDVTADEIGGITPVYYPLTLTFRESTPEYELYGSILSMLARGNSSERSDMLAAKYTALKAQEKLYGADNSDALKAVTSRLEGYNPSGYYSLLAYSAGDPVLTAKLLAADPGFADAVRREILISSYNKELNSIDQIDPETLCASLLGLAALEEPVLDRLYSVASSAKNYPAEAKLYLAAAFACIGDYSAANDIYGQIKSEKGILDNEYGTLYFSGSNLAENVKLTSAAMLTAARISASDALYMARYLTGNSTRDESSETALAAYLRFFRPAEAAEAKTFSYRIGDCEVETVTLERGRTYGITLTKSEHKAFSIVSIDDGVSIKASYAGSAEEAFTDVNGRISVEKKIEPYGTNFYRVTLTFRGTSTRIYETFDVTDCIPSGARYVTILGRNSGSSASKGIYTSASVFNTSGQMVKGWLTVRNTNYDRTKDRTNTCTEYSFTATLSYTIRGAVDGEFVVESAVLRNSATGIFAASDIGETRYLIIKDGSISSKYKK